MTMHFLIERDDMDLVKRLRGEAVEHEPGSVRPWCEDRGIRFVPVEAGRGWTFTMIELDEKQAFEFKMRSL